MRRSPSCKNWSIVAFGSTSRDVGQVLAPWSEIIRTAPVAKRGLELRTSRRTRGLNSEKRTANYVAWTAYNVCD